MDRDERPARWNDETAADDEDTFEIDLSDRPPITPAALSHVRMHPRRGGLVEPQFVIEEVSDPVVVARFRAQDERARQNEAWLQSHWSELLPSVRGRFVAVAGQEAFIADSQQDARAKAVAAHPEDDGMIEQYVRPERGPRLYAHQG